MRIRFLIFIILCFNYNLAFGQELVASISNNEVQPNSSLYHQLHLLQQKVKQGSPIKIAIIDDGFRLSHKTLKKYICSNVNEVPGNYQDEDKNGYIDDIQGWDCADNDKDVSIKKGKEDMFYHGTYIASIIISVIESAFGEEASKLVKIIPIKSLSDNAKNTFLKDAYKGFRYADKMNADIICTAWSGGIITDDDKAVINKLIQKGTIIVSAAGNFSTEQIISPADIEGVICVTAVDSLQRKIKVSNYGMRVDFSAPGMQIYGAHPTADNSFIYESGTSPATAIMTGCVSILKILYPSASNLAIRNALQNTAKPIDEFNLPYSGKLGAGLPDMEKAIQFLGNFKVEKYLSFDSTKTKGDIFIKKTKSAQSWKINPPGDYKGVHFYSNSATNDGLIKVSNKDTILFEGKLNELFVGLYLTGSDLNIDFLAKHNNDGNTVLAYYMETMDSSTLYCKGTTEIIVEGNGIITDNSNEKNYTNDCSCQWQLVAPPGKHIRVEMEELDTEPNMDYLWLFDGTSTLQERILAKFSGYKKPPIVQSVTNKLLLWFLTDKVNTGKGWKLQYQVVD